MPAFAPFRHNVDSADHARSFRVTDAGTNNVSVEAGRFRQDQTVFNFATATALGPLANGTHWVYITNLGVITSLLGGPYPANTCPLARVTVAGGDVTGIVDDRCFFALETGGAGGANTLDQAYDQGGAGAGRIITVDSGAVELRHTADLFMLATRDPGDPRERFALTRDGALMWGSGAGIQDILLFRAAANRLAFAAGDTLSVQWIADTAGNRRITTAAASPHVTVSGDLHIFGGTGQRLKVGTLGPTGNNIIESQAKVGAYGIGAIVNLFVASHIGGGISVDSGSTVRGVFGLPIVAVANAAIFVVVYGLQFIPRVVGGGGASTVPQLFGVYTSYSVGTYTGTIAAATGVEVEAPTFAGVGWTITLSTGVHIGNYGNNSLIADAYGLTIDDMTTNTGFQRLIEAGPATPYLRLIGGGNPGANQTNLYLKEAANLRQVQWMDPGAGGANFVGGERVMILV